MIIGSAWAKAGEYGEFISMAFDEAWLESKPVITKNHQFKLTVIDYNNRTRKETSPDYNIVMSIKNKDKDDRGF